MWKTQLAQFFKIAYVNTLKTKKNCQKHKKLKKLILSEKCERKIYSELKSSRPKPLRYAIY